MPVNRGIVMVLALGAVGRPAWAQEGSAPEPIEVVVTGTRTAESSQRATVRTDVVTREEAERRGATNVAEALSGQLGVQVNPGAYGALGNVSAIQIQGFDLDRVLVLQDGERVIGNVGGAIDLAQLPLADVSRIEVVAGPMSSLYGASAIGGVVNILSAPPMWEGPSGRFRLEGRSRRGLLAQGTGAYRREDTWVAADASLQRQDGIPLYPDSEILAMPDLTSTSLGIRGGVPITRRLKAQARLRWARQSTMGREDQLVPGLGHYRIDLPERTDRVSVHVAEDMDLGRGSSFRLSLGRQWAFDASRRDRYGSELDQARERSDVLSSIEALATLADGPRTWVIGARAEAEKLDQELTNTELVGGALRTGTTTEVPRATLGSAALYAQLGYKLTNQLTVMPGVRGELHERYGGVVAPRLAVAYAPSPKWMLRASGGRGFRAPSAKEFGFSFDHLIYGYRVLGNPKLAPETSWGVSGDVTVRPWPKSSIRAGAFANWVDQLIDLVPSESTIAHIADYRYENVGRARTAGWQIDTSFTPASWLRADAGYAYLWTRDDTRGRPLQGRPPHTLSASIRATLPWELELCARWRGVTDAFIDEGTRAPSFSLLDTSLTRPIWRYFAAYVGVLNVLDVHKDPSLLGDQRPLAGRTFYVGLTAELPSENDG